MLFAIDIGNTDTTLGVFTGEELRATWHMATEIHRMADEYATVILDLLGHHGLSASDIKKVALCSVVPPLITTFEELIQRYFRISPLVEELGLRRGSAFAWIIPERLALTAS